jgi:hypothetical protein
MRKLFVAATVLLLAGAAVAGAVHVKQSLENGVCPLTGRPIHGRASVACPSTPECPYTDDRCLESKVPAADAATSATTSDESASPCCRARRHCCAGKKDCEKTPAQVEEKPTAPANENP